MIEDLVLPHANARTAPAGPTATRIDDHLVGLLASESAEVQQYLVLRQVIERAQAASGLSTVAVTSAAIGDGKTTTAINLAGTLGRSPTARVLLIDADLHVPAVAARLGIGNVRRPGLADLIGDTSLTLNDVVFRLQPFNLSVMTAGQIRNANPYNVLQAPRFREILAVARQSYDYIVLDTPPAVLVPDCRLIEAGIDGFLIVVAAHRTPQRLLEEALTILSPEKCLGLVFNRADRPFRGAYGAYYRYGYGVASATAHD